MHGGLGLYSSTCVTHFSCQARVDICSGVADVADKAAFTLK